MEVRVKVKAMASIVAYVLRPARGVDTADPAQQCAFSTYHSCARYHVRTPPRHRRNDIPLVSSYGVSSGVDL